MSNLEKVLGILVDMKGAEDMLDVAETLKDAGLLMPDLPEPDSVKLNGDVKYFIYDAAQVRQDAESDYVQLYSKTFLTPTESRRLALAILAACEHAEKEQGNE